MVTKRSWDELRRLRQKVQFVLIGGWAVYLYTKGLKSKDIDILIEYGELSSLSQSYEMNKNDRLKKYEAVRDVVQIDVYLPHYSRLGIPVEELMKHTHSRDGFTVLDSEYLIALKLFTLSQRGRTPKGRKDFLDLLALFQVFERTPFSQARELVRLYQIEGCDKTFMHMIHENSRIPELDLTTHRYAAIRKTLTSIYIP